MKELKEKLKNQDIEFAYINKLMAEKFKMDILDAPEISLDSILNPKKKKMKMYNKPLVKMVFSGAFLLIILFAVAIFLSEDEKVQKNILNIEKVAVRKIKNSNQMNAVNMIYKSGKAKITKDAPIPMVWISKGDVK